MKPDLKYDLLYLAELANFARTGPKRPPPSLVTFVIRMGGLRDENGEISHLTGSYRSLPSLISRKGLSLDKAAFVAWECGYIPGSERPTPADFLCFLQADLHDRSVYAADDFEAAQEYENAETARNDLDALGLLIPRKMARVETALREAAAYV